MSTIAVAAALAGLTTSFHLLTAVLAATRCARRRRRTRPDAPDIPAISVVRPVCGIDAVLERTLASTFRLEGIPHEVIFCAASPRDAVLPTVRRLVEEHPEVPGRVLVGEEHINQNPKLNNVAKGWRAAEHGWIAMIDDNVALEPDALEWLRASWRRDTGLVCSPPIGTDPDGFAAEIECAFLNTFQARWQYASDAVGLGFAQGKVMFFRRDVIDAAGGIERLGAEPAEDAAATKVVRAAGLKVRLADRPFLQPLGRRALAAVWRRQVRWARLRRVTFPLFFAPEILTGALVPTLAVATAVQAADLSPAYVGLFVLAWYAVEAALAAVAGWHLSWRSPIAWLARDLALPVLWVQAWAGNDFEWRGNEMTVGRGAA